MQRALVVRDNEICPRCQCLGAKVTVMVERDDNGATQEKIVELLECRANRCLPY